MRKRQREKWLAQTMSACRLAPQDQKLAVLQASIASLPPDEQLYAQGVISLHSEGIADPTNIAASLDERTVGELLKMLKPTHIAALVTTFGGAITVAWQCRGLYDDVATNHPEPANRVQSAADESQTESADSDGGAEDTARD